MRPRSALVLAAVALLATSTIPAWTPSPAKQLELAGNRPGAPPVYMDGDRDGYFNFMDCNDDNASVHPFAGETANGIDDDCNGVVDDGFDTSVDWPTIELTHKLWPRDAAPSTPEWVRLDTAPQIVATDDGFAVVWSDIGERIRLVRFALSETGGGLAVVRIDDPPLILRSSTRSPDLAWTGTRFGVVYEDRSGPVPEVRLMTLDADGSLLYDRLLATAAMEPKIAWGQDRFGVVWRVLGCAGDCLRFQRFDRDGFPWGEEEILAHSGSGAAITFSGTAVEFDDAVFNAHEGWFGIAYQAYFAFRATNDVLLTARPREPFGTSLTVHVNDGNDPYTVHGALPSIGGNASGFTVCWHLVVDGKDGACARSFSLDGLGAVQEFAPDRDAGRASAMVWTGSEFVMVNDNFVGDPPTGFDVHVRRLDPSGNSHLAAGWGPWRELNLRSNWTSGSASVNPDIARGHQGMGIVWIEREGLESHGRVFFSLVIHN